MSLVFAALTPHSPILIPAIGRENLKRLAETAAAFEQLKTELAEVKPDSLLIISPHGRLEQDSYLINFSPTYKINFEEFGDFSAYPSPKPDTETIYRLKSNSGGWPIEIISHETLDYGTAVPLILLTDFPGQSRLIPISYSFMDYRSHFEFGAFLKQEILTSPRRIAVIASGDLSHRLSKTAPGGYSSKGKKFDRKIIEILNAGRFSELTEIKPELSEAAGDCGLRSILILAGILSQLSVKPSKAVYETPFGIGYLTIRFKF